MNAHPFLTAVAQAELVRRTGRVQRILPTVIEADGPSAALGDLVEIGPPGAAGLAEVVGLDRKAVRLALLDDRPVEPGAEVRARGAAEALPVGDGLLGRAVDGLGRPIDGAAPLRGVEYAGRRAIAASPLQRVSPTRTMSTGVRAIDGTLTLGQGQRIGVFAASGVGKTTLMSQILRDAEADRCVVCLVGERGREVEDIWSRTLSEKARARTVLVAATSDETAAMRVRAVDLALAIAEHWRAQGHHVLFFLDSVTRLAMALREIGFAAGEPPTVRAYTPNVFSAMPRLVERCGAVKGSGAITAIMTVLSESDDNDDPVCELMKSLLDGHIVLSRAIAEQGRFPAIDVPRSISRLAGGLMDEHQRRNAMTAVQLLSTYDASRTLIESGLYAAGSNPQIDKALERRPALLDFLVQSHREPSPFAETVKRLAQAVGEAP